jgi:ubiquinone/menaquinone biosynthesis C-methylase UbiE
MSKQEISIILRDNTTATTTLGGLMDTVESTLKTLSAGRILDVATGGGQFINFLVETLKDYSEILGVDTSDKAAVFLTAFKEKPNIRFIQMDAGHLDFPNSSFDTVCISNSLHHMPYLNLVLAEMLRVLRPNGNFIIAEMFCDEQTETQMTHVLLHHWWAAVDTAKGIAHRETYTRQQILDIAAHLGLQKILVDEVSDLTSDPREPETVNYLVDVTDQYLKRIEGLEEEATLREHGLELRQRIAEVGFHGATSLLVIGEKA